MCSTDYDPASIYNKKIVTAKKEHDCDECARIIRKGERYHYVFAVWDSKPTTYKTCQHCSVAQSWLYEECGGFLHAALEDEIFEHAFDYNKMFLYRWLVGIRRHWKRFKDDGIMPLPKLMAED